MILSLLMIVCLYNNVAPDAKAHVAYKICKNAVLLA